MEFDKSKYFEVFSFGDSPAMADELLDFVLKGKKTATVSIILEGDPVPTVGDISLVLNSKGEPKCEIKTTFVTTVPFKNLTWDMVKLEGEDDTFEQWRNGNLNYWKRDSLRRGYDFSEETPITFEIFELNNIYE